MRIGLCLSGGGVKGAAHIGIIKALEEDGIKAEYISGTSSGSIVAALYSMGYNSKDILKLFEEYGGEVSKIDFITIIKIIFGLIFKRKICIEGLNTGNKLGKLIQEQAEKKNVRIIKDIRNPLIIPSVNLCDGSIYLFTSQKNSRSFSDDIKVVDNIEIGKAVQASCSYPGIFCPTDILGMKLIDGGVRQNTPWKELKNIGAEKIITVVFSEDKKIKRKINIIDSITRSMGIMMHELYNYEIDGTEYLLNIKTENIGLLEMEKIYMLYEIGYKTAKNEMKKIKEYLQK